MDVELDIDKLREDLINYFGSAQDIFPIAEADLVYVNYCSNDELIRMAINNNFDLNNYLIEKRIL